MKERRTRRTRPMAAVRIPAPRSATPEERERWIAAVGAARARTGARIHRLNLSSVRVLVIESEPALETKIFGVPRVHFDILPVPESGTGAKPLVRRIAALVSDGTHASLRLPGDAGPLAWFFQEAGWQWADLSIEYAFLAPPESLPGPWTTKPVRRGESPGLARSLARSLADGRLIRTRFTTDQALEPRARDLYEAWALGRLSSADGSDICAWTVREPKHAAAGCLIASRIPGERGVARIELNAVFPGMRARGAYTALAARSLQELFARGFREVRVRTSGSTLSVQRVWQRLGGRPRSSDIVLHRPPCDTLAP